MKLFGSKVYQIAATLVRIEALFLAGLAIYLAVRTATSKVEELDAILAEIIFLSFASAGLFFAGRGFIAKRNFARAPTVLANLIALGVAYSSYFTCCAICNSSPRHYLLIFPK
jgi:uncharacterized protein involved in response to NO